MLQFVPGLPEVRDGYRYLNMIALYIPVDKINIIYCR